MGSFDFEKWNVGVILQSLETLLANFIYIGAFVRPFWRGDKDQSQI